MNKQEITAAIAGMTEDQAEEWFEKSGVSIPSWWNDPLERDVVLGIQGQAELNAHLNFGELAYGGEEKLGKNAKGIWHRRNVDGQGHPAENTVDQKKKKS